MSRIFAPERTLVIRNPASGRWSSQRRAARLEQLLARHGYRVQHTSGAGCAGELAQDFLARQPDASLVVIGGDGTIFEAIERLAVHVALAIYPGGTINLLARSLALPADPDAWLALLERDEMRCVHFARCNNRPFTCVGSVGFDAEAVKHVNPARKRLLQEWAYGLAAFKLYWSYKLPEYHLILDGVRVDDPCVTLLFGLVPYYGSPRVVFPAARTGQGELDVALLTGQRKRLLWKYAWGMLGGWLPRLRGVEYRKARTLRVETDPPVAVQLDGDYFCQTPVEIEIEPRPRHVLAANAGLQAREPSETMWTCPS